MSIRTPADVIRAVDYGKDLTKLLHDYFELWRKHCNGINGITLKKGDFWVQIVRPISETMLSVRIVFIDEVVDQQPYRTPIYDLGSNESDGPDGVLYYDEGVNEISTRFLNGIAIDVSITGFLAENVEQYLIELRKDHDEREREKARLAEIATLEKRLGELKK